MNKYNRLKATVGGGVPTGITRITKTLNPVRAALRPCWLKTSNGCRFTAGCSAGGRAASYAHVELASA
eukprot:SAG25_NODE_16_length_24288_cov_31.926950_6_plen_68_part_00